MPRSNKGCIGRKNKKVMQGSKSYQAPPNNPALKQSAKRKKIDITPPLSPQIHRRTKKHLARTHRETICLRYAIYYQYVDILDAPHPEHWHGQNGTISKIRKCLHLRISQTRTIKKTLEEIVRCMAIGYKYDGLSELTHGRKTSIIPGSQEESLIANWMESHCGFRMTTILVNEHRREGGKERVSRFAVMSAFHRLKPKVQIIEKIQSGGNNEAWIQASYNITKQMKIMMGELTDIDEIMTDREGIPDRDKNYAYDIVRTK